MRTTTTVVSGRHHPRQIETITTTRIAIYTQATRRVIQCERPTMCYRRPLSAIENDECLPAASLPKNQTGTVNTKITGGTFSANEADFGGFLYNRGVGVVSCTGGSVEGNQAVDGGGVYIVKNATLDWACDLKENTALSGPAM